jgi:hypothetical protein
MTGESGPALRASSSRNSNVSKRRVATSYKGNSRNGQFFLRRIESLGIGWHLHF